MTEPFESGASSTPSSDSGEHGRFLPGTVLARRYRIVGLLGRGGMGEVYRADDLKLGQAVALKLLPERLAGDPERLEYFHNEVRLARQVSHPNVCRVYDIGEADGQHYLSMEYVDGEDLATLIRRIGRLPPDKGVDVARQLCAGLAAAHDRGVLHRDLKPANVMLDGRGRVRITDFGLARLTDEKGGTGVVAGTPAYMAPEQLAGREVTEQSDVYSLGLVLFELFTGKPAFQGDTPAELARLRTDSMPSAPSHIVADIDPAVERVILQCLEKEPKERPRSALAVSAALPGGDPLAAALAAGETPSPEMVAAAGESGGLRPVVGGVLLGCLVAGLAAVALIADRSTVAGRVRTLIGNPAVLEAAAREILGNLGYAEPGPGQSAYGLEYNRSYLQRVDADRSPSRWEDIERGRPPAVYFWYRQGPRPLSPTRKFSSVVSFDDPPQLHGGMARVRLDLDKRLLEFHAVAPLEAEGEADASEPNWAEFFRLAGLDQEDFQPIRGASGAGLRWSPALHADHWEAWESKEGDSRLRVEAASLGGRPVNFRVIWPDWTEPAREQDPPAVLPGVSREVTSTEVYYFYVCGAVALVAAPLVARRNIRLGRSDRQGARRVGLFIFCWLTLVWIFRTSHVPDSSLELVLFFDQNTWNLLMSVMFWLIYLAVEPYVRRIWPDSLISWSRLLRGQWRDPRIGRDLLVGILVGVCWAALLLGMVPLAAWLGEPAHLRRSASLDTLLGTRHCIAVLLDTQQWQVRIGIFLLFSLVLHRYLLRNRWLAATVCLVLTVVFYGHGHFFVYWFGGAVCAVSLLYLLTRYGLLTLIAALASMELLVAFPVTADLSAAHWNASLFALCAVAAPGVYGFYISIGGRSLFSDRPART